MRFRRMRTAAVVAALSLTLAACGGDDDTDTSEPGSGSAPQSDLKVGLAFDIGGRGDQSFNDAAAAGLEKAKTELGVTSQESEAAQSEPDTAKEERLRVLASSGYNPVIAVGFAYAGPLGKVAKEFPDTKFAIVDDASEASTADNISNLVFAEHEGSFLVGVIAALKSKAGNLGFIGGVDVPLIHKFEAGFKAGAEAAKPGIKVQVKYLTQPPDFTGFNDPAKGKTAAQGMLDAGADVLYHAAGGSGGGMFEAAKAGGALAIGVDSDQYNTAAPAVKDVIITSMLKKVDVAVFDFISTVVDDEFKAGPLVYDLEQGGVDYSTTGGMVDDVKDQVDEFKEKVISGEITVPEK